MKKLFLTLLTTLLLFSGCSSNKEESSKQEERKPIDPHTPEEVQSIFIGAAFKETNISGTLFYELDDKDYTYSFMFIPSSVEGGYSMCFDYGTDFTYYETQSLSFASIDLSDDVSCTYYLDTKEFKDDSDKACDDSIVKKIDEGMEIMDDLLYKMGVSKEDMVGFAKQCSVNYFGNQKNDNSSFDIEKESDGQFKMSTFYEVNYVIGTDWIQSKDEDDSKTYACLSDNGNVLFMFGISRDVNNEQGTAEDFAAYLSTANEIDAVKNSGYSYENVNLVLTDYGVKLVRYNMLTTQNSYVFVAADILTDQYRYTLSITGEDYLKDNLNEVFDSLTNFITLND